MRKVFLSLVALFVLTATANADLVQSYAFTEKNLAYGAYTAAPTVETGKSYYTGSKPTAAEFGYDGSYAIKPAAGVVVHSSLFGNANLTDIASVSYRFMMNLDDTITNGFSPLVNARFTNSTDSKQRIALAPWSTDPTTKGDNYWVTSEDSGEGFTTWTIDVANWTGSNSNLFDNDLKSLSFDMNSAWKNHGDAYLDWVLISLNDGSEYFFNYNAYGFENEFGNPFDSAATPEPASMLIFGLGLAGLGLAGRRRMKNKKS